MFAKAASEKRRQRSNQTRQRRKVSEQEVSQRIARLEVRLRQTTEEKDRYVRERDHFRNLFLSNQPKDPRTMGEADRSEDAPSA